MNIKTNLLENYINFVNITTKQKKYFKIGTLFFDVNIFLFLFFLSFKYLNEKLFSLHQTFQTGNLDSNLITRQYKLDLMARFIEIKSLNSKLRQDQIAKELGCSSITLQRYRHDKYMFSPYRIPPNSHKRKQKILNRKHDLERPQLTSDDLKNLK